MGAEFMHQRPDQHKSFPGWQEPGLWRPKWVMEREFYATEGCKAYKDRLYLKLKPDRTVYLYGPRKRPLLEIFKKVTTKVAEKKKSLFEKGTEGAPDKSEELTSYHEMQKELYSADGSWSFTDEAPLPSAKIQIETKEGTDRSRVRHESRCEWGTMDGYAAKFKRGRIYKFKGVQKGSDIPLGKYVAGTFTIRANGQRPLVSKDFLAFQ